MEAKGKKFKWALVGSVGAIVLVIVASRLIHSKNQSGQTEDQTGAEWRTTAPNSPVVRSPGSNPAPLDRFIPEAQQNVDPNQVKITLEIKTDPKVPGFIPEKLSVKSGEVVKIVFRNFSEVNHYDNFVLVRPGSESQVADAALKVGPDAGYIPVLPGEIIVHSKMVEPGGSDAIVFRAPTVPGSYPYISTSPRRWKAMHGVLEVTESKPSS